MSVPRASWLRVMIGEGGTETKVARLARRKFRRSLNGITLGARTSAGSVGSLTPIGEILFVIRHSCRRKSV